MPHRACTTTLRHHDREASHQQRAGDCGSVSAYNFYCLWNSTTLDTYDTYDILMFQEIAAVVEQAQAGASVRKCAHRKQTVGGAAPEPDRPPGLVRGISRDG